MPLRNGTTRPSPRAPAGTASTAASSWAALTVTKHTSTGWSSRVAASTATWTSPRAGLRSSRPSAARRAAVAGGARQVTWSPRRARRPASRPPTPPGPSTATRAGGSGSATLGEPGVARGVLAGVVGVEVDEAALDLPVADLEHVAPAAGAVLGVPGPPGPVLVLAVAGPLHGQHVAAGEDPVELVVVVLDGLEGAADVAEHLADLLPAVGNAPLGEVDLGVVGEQVEDAAPVLGHPGPVERLQVLHDQRLAVVVGHDGSFPEG